VITTASTVNCVGYYTLGNYRMKCWVHPDSHGHQDVVHAITNSCNVFFAEMGDRLGIDVMNRYAKAFGLGEPTGIELSESLGNLAGEASRLQSGGGAWYPADTVMAAIGQSDNAFTPLQLCNYVTTLLRGGDRYEVHILDSVREYYTDEIIHSVTPAHLGGISLSSRTVSTVMEGMKSMVESSATASFLFGDVPVAVGGKTGTAEVGTDNDNGLFVCAAPYNAPVVISACVIEGANTGRYAEGVAAAVLEEYYGVNEAED
jgi:penicillin-binding protein 2